MGAHTLIFRLHITTADSTLSQPWRLFCYFPHMYTGLKSSWCFYLATWQVLSHSKWGDAVAVIVCEFSKLLPPICMSALYRGCTDAIQQFLPGNASLHTYLTAI